MTFFSRVFRRDAGNSKKAAKQNGTASKEPQKPQWTDAWLRTEVGPEEVQELLHGCTLEIKARALDTPFLLLPFRPTSDPSAARTFVRNYFSSPADRPTSSSLRGDQLLQELRLTEPMVLCSVMKWCWSRLPGGVVTWEAYELFKMGEQDSQLARDAFSTFIPISVDSDARTKIIIDFFDLMAAIAAHGKSNGLGGRKLSRYAGWWAFEHVDTGNGFESSYKTWASAADATSHLFFAYLRSLSPDSIRGTNGISSLPISLQGLVQATEYPPEAPSLLQIQTTKVVMVVNTVSPTPFALLRRAKNFEYRDSDHALQEFSNYDDPVQALTDECRRVLRSISSANESEVSTSKASTSLPDASWSRFEDIGFGATIEESDAENENNNNNNNNKGGSSQGPLSLNSAPNSRTADLGRPTTPSWADFLSSGFADENAPKDRPPFLLPPDKVLPPIHTTRGQSSHSHKRNFDQESNLEPGELASITSFDIDGSFWWVWISSLSGEETAARKSVFGRCALVETSVTGGGWLVLEEQVKGAAPEPEPGAYIAEKKSFFGFRTRKGRLTRSKSSAKKVSSSNKEPYKTPNSSAPMSKTSIGPDQHARIQAAAAELQRKHREQENEQELATDSQRDDATRAKTNSVLTLQPSILSEASQAMKWASNYDKSSVRAAYLSNSRAGTGAPADSLNLDANGNSRSETPKAPTPEPEKAQKAPVKEEPPAPAPAAEPSPKPEGPKDVAFEKKPVETAAPKQSEAPPAAAQPAAPSKAEEPARPKKSSDSTEEHKKLKKKPANTGLKGMFGKKKNESSSNKPQSSAKLSSEGKSTVASTRAALENRAAQAAKESTPPRSATPPVRKSTPPARKPAPAAPPASEAPAPAPAPADPTPAPAAEEPKAVPEPQMDPSVALSESDGPPKTGREEEFDNLSRVDTIEQEQADREFANFDHQSPLVDQPAFVPDTPPAPKSPEQQPTPLPAPKVPEPEPEPEPAQPPAAASSPEPSQPKDSTDSPAKESPQAAQDRWAQIRKNTADRKSNGEQQQASAAEKTEKAPAAGGGGQDSIEQRAARIRARVAELTKNMEGK